MRFVIIGAGTAGHQLAQKLCMRNHDVVVVDRDATALDLIEGQLDVLTIRGDGASPIVLEKAQIEKADLVASLTNRDEINILACNFALQLGVPNRIARINDTDFRHPDSRFDLKAAGVDLVVSKDESTAIELYNILRHPGTLDVVDLFGSRVQAVGFRVDMNSPLIRAPLHEVLEDEMNDQLRFIGAMRGEELIVPRGDTQFLIGDDLYFVSQSSYKQKFLDWAIPDHPTFHKIIIAGGGALGLNLARRLDDFSVPTCLIESNRERAEYCSQVLEKTLVLHGDALKDEMFEQVGMVSGTAFVATTGDDENNIISCMLAEKQGANFTVARIGRPDYVSIINSQSLLDRAVSPYETMSNTIVHFLRGKHIRSSTLLHHLPGELLEVDLVEQSKWASQMIKDIKMPRGAMIAAADRTGEILIPTGSLTLEPGDHLLLFASAQAIPRLESLFR